MAKHQAISKELRAEIAAGKYRGDEALPSEAQLVERYGVSRPTIARALRDLQNEGLVYRRAGAGTFITPSENPAKEAPVLGMLVPQRGMIEIFEYICGDIGALAKAQGYGLLWGDSPLHYKDLDASPKHALEVCHTYIQKGVAGVFFAPLEYDAESESTNIEILNLFSQAGIPVVLLDRDAVPFPKRSPFDLVCIDNFAAGFILAEHMIRLGRRNLRFLATPGSATSINARSSGIREAIIQQGLEQPDDLLVFGDPLDREFIRKLKPGIGCDCIISGNDTIANQLLSTLKAMGLKIPDQVSIAGFDDVRKATLPPLPLTTIHQPLNEISETSLRTMLGRIKDPSIPPRMITLQPRLVIRESCGTYLSKS